MKKRILIIDDDVDICFLLSKYFESSGFEAAYAFRGSLGIKLLKESPYDVVLCDFRLPDADGFEMLKQIKKESPASSVIIVTGYSDVRAAVNVIKRGAFDYVTKPVIPEEILDKVNAACEASAEKAEALAAAESEPVENAPKATERVKTKRVGDRAQGKEYISGTGPLAQQLERHIALVAPTDMTVVVRGETGVGKEIVARRIHAASRRSERPFFALDCGALPDNLAASELFGHKKGSFTGAFQDKKGFFLMADGGTLFLDEIGNLSYPVQVQLLRVVQERMVRRLGEAEARPVDVRLLVATNEDLRKAADKGDFREDLYHRLNEFGLLVPPLRERGEDIEAFADFFLQKSNAELGKDVKGFSAGVQQIFRSYPWPGNLREMRNVVKRAVLLATGPEIKEAHLPLGIAHSQPEDAGPVEGEDLKAAAAKAESEAILEALREAKYNKTKAARALNIDRKTLYNKMKQYNIK